MEEKKRRLAEGYSRSARHYDELAGASYLAGLQRLLPLAVVPPWPAVLDIGCGTGINLLEIIRVFGPPRRAAGIDLAPGMIEATRQKLARLSLTAELVVGDAEQLPWEDAAFDLVICNSVFHWFTNRARAAAEMFRVLRPGGQLLFACAASPCFAEWYAVLAEVFAELGLPPFELPSLPPPEEVHAALSEAGFTFRHFSPLQLRQVVTDPRTFTRQLATVSPGWAASLSAAELAAVEAALTAKLQREAPAGVTVTWSAVEAVAVKPLW